MGLFLQFKGATVAHYDIEKENRNSRNFNSSNGQKNTWFLEWNKGHGRAIYRIPIFIPRLVIPPSLKLL